MDWSGVDYVWIIVMFLSAVWTLILTAPIHCRASIAETLMQWHISTNLMKTQTPLHLEWPCTIGLEHSDFRLLELFVIAKWHTSALNIVCTKVKYPNNFVIKRKIMWSHSYRHKLPSRWILCQINTSVGSRPHADTQHLEGKRLPETSMRFTVECLSSNWTDSDSISQVWRAESWIHIVSQMPPAFSEVSGSVYHNVIWNLSMSLSSYRKMGRDGKSFKWKCISDALQVKGLDTSVHSLLPLLFLALTKKAFIWSKILLEFKTTDSIWK